MCENVKKTCSCEEGYDKGAIKKTIENNIFTIYGNLTKSSSIILKYHGPLTDTLVDNSTALQVVYFFNSCKDDKKTVTLDKCTKCLGECYCTTIDLQDFNNISFSFSNDKNLENLQENQVYELKIEEDPITNIMQRYGFEENKKLPVCNDKKEDKLNVFKFLIDSIKSFFKKNKET